MATINVDEVIDTQPLGRLRLIIMLLISAAVIVDGFDIQMIAFVTPVLLDEWGVTRTELALAISAALIGMAIGAPIGGSVGDQLGRRRAITWSVYFFGIASIAAAIAENVAQLAMYRFIAGVGFGA
ncbi:MAG: MFS transporter, partial [Sphingorhabdus sp.]|uniref:MFS transporter n=1 Tax=Sphingorhabdus sp. TaxID=1902408 RepID=UPI003CBDD79E